MNTTSGHIVSPIGIGARHLGGDFTIHEDGAISHSAPSSEADDINAIITNIQHGSNYIDTCHHYGYGKSLDIISQAISQHILPRGDLWINAKLEDHYHSIDEILNSLDRYCSILNTDYIDSYQIHAPMNYIDHKTVIHTLNDLVRQGRIRYISVSNFNKEQLQEVYALTDHLISHEIHYNLVTRINEENQVINYCNDNQISLIAYQPLKRNSIATANYPLLVELSKKYKKSQNQIMINRLCIHKGYRILCKTTNHKHILENIDSLSFRLHSDDYKKLDDFRPPLYKDHQPYDYRGNDPQKVKIRKL